MFETRQHGGTEPQTGLKCSWLFESSRVSSAAEQTEVAKPSTSVSKNQDAKCSIPAAFATPAKLKSVCDVIDTTTMASPQQSAPPSLREIQRKALLRVLNLNSADDSGALRNDGLPQVDNHE